jgi:hypothetical protein
MKWSGERGAGEVRREREEGSKGGREERRKARREDVWGRDFQVNEHFKFLFMSNYAITTLYD